MTQFKKIKEKRSPRNIKLKIINFSGLGRKSETIALLVSKFLSKEKS